MLARRKKIAVTAVTEVIELCLRKSRQGKVVDIPKDLTASPAISELFAGSAVAPTNVLP